MGNSVPERLARVETTQTHNVDRLERIEGILDGVSGNGGLQGDVRDLLNVQRTTGKAQGEAIEAITSVVVGPDGDAGIVATVNALKLQVRILMGVLAIVAEEVIRQTFFT